MNWKRGLIQVWIVLSVLWMAITAWLIDPFQKYRDATGPEIIRIGGAAIQFPRNTPLPEIRNALSDFIEAELNKKLTSPELYLDVGVNGLEATVDRAMSGLQRRSLVQTLLPVVGIILLPPLFFVAGGLVILWVARGFRNQPQRASN